MFSGVIARRKLQWGYECEHCGKIVRYDTEIQAKIGSEHKATTNVYVPRAKEGIMIENVKQDLAAICARLDADRQGDYLQSIVNDDGRCPQCKKYQHWAPAFLDKNNKEMLNTGLGCLQFILKYIAISGGCVAIIILIMLLTDPQFAADGLWDDILKISISSILTIGASIGFHLIKLKDKRDRDEALEDLENKERKNPSLIIWLGEAYIVSTGYRVI